MNDENLDKEAERIQKDYERFRFLVNKIKSRKDEINKMVDYFEDRLFTCPASSNVRYHCAFPGGLLNHSLRVCGNALKLAKTFDFEIEQESIILSSLFHDFGKIGSLEEPLYVPQTSSYWRERGKPYEWNYNIQYFPDAHRCVWLFQHFGIKLSQEEWLAIVLNNGCSVEENRVYMLKEPNLAVIVHMADYLSCKYEKEHNL